jgi:hypothetical protein
MRLRLQISPAVPLTAVGVEDCTQLQLWKYPLAIFEVCGHHKGVAETTAAGLGGPGKSRRTTALSGFFSSAAW